MRLKWNKQVTT